MDELEIIFETMADNPTKVWAMSFGALKGLVISYQVGTCTEIQFVKRAVEVVEIADRFIKKKGWIG